MQKLLLHLFQYARKDFTAKRHMYHDSEEDIWTIMLKDQYNSFVRNRLKYWCYSHESWNLIPNKSHLKSYLSSKSDKKKH